ncbi:polysaccharide deacetylase family protein [Thermocrinis minervae]|uniref:Polysaccharide deacetylase n=1 Tax=Thermocrinis minervae TaxID=381751 RepID=A0A1M6SSD1_9AQUI|nr:polysaccharide deacetylase family protein [Thermocrinis minervae]SHK47498.1 Polysaccharide deacetylase [Thermocrinis minervae]
MLAVLLYHKVVKWPSFDVWWKTFDLEMSILKKLFRVVDLDQILEYLHLQRLPDNPTVAITFDDGYADNWIYAYPILKKHRLKATLFITTSRIQKSDKRRPTLLDYWEGKVGLKELYTPKTMHEANLEFLKERISEDFLTVGEIRSMRDVFNFGWHSVHHTKDFYEEKILGFYEGKGHWSLLHAYGEEPRTGYPLFPLKGSLSVRVGKLRKEVKEFIKSLGKNFFQRKEWKRELSSLLKKNFSSMLEFEDPVERYERITREILLAKEELEGLTDQKVYHGAYPFGDYDDLLKSRLSEYLSSAFTTEKRSILLGDDPYLLPRITVPKDLWSFMYIVVKLFRRRIKHV